MELRSGGEALRTEPQVFDLLCQLIENRERVVTRDDLISSVWKGRIVSETTISARINAARRVVGDDGRRQKIIKTVPRRGYRFIADVEAKALYKGVEIPANDEARVVALRSYHILDTAPEAEYDDITTMATPRVSMSVLANCQCVRRQFCRPICSLLRICGAIPTTSICRR